MQLSDNFKKQISFIFSSLVTEHRQSYGSLRMSDWFNRPGIIEEGDNYNDLTRGLATQPELKSDRFHDSEVNLSSFYDLSR